MTKKAPCLHPQPPSLMTCSRQLMWTLYTFWQIIIYLLYLDVKKQSVLLPVAARDLLVLLAGMEASSLSFKEVDPLRDLLVPGPGPILISNQVIVSSGC